MNINSIRGPIACATVIGMFLAAGNAAADVKIPEGTAFPIRFDEKLSSKTASEGDRFSISLSDDVTLSDGTVLHAGYRGVGEVTQADKRGMMGKAGQLNVRFDYLKVGETRIRLRGNRGEEGKGAVGATVALTVLFGPLGLLKHGHDVEIQTGQEMTVYADTDVALTTPVAAPPADI